MTKLLYSGNLILFVMGMPLLAQCQTVPAKWQGDKKAAVSMTFDDGLTCQISNAFLILQQHNFKATFFIITASIGRYPHAVYMDADDILTLVANGQEIGNHTITHPRLSTSADAKWPDLSGCDLNSDNKVSFPDFVFLHDVSW